MSHLLKSRSRNSAFTLVELMIVIAIIGVLASLATVGVMKALEKGKMVAARTEISQLEAAIAAAKQNLGGVDYLPSAIRLHYRADQLMNDNSQIGINTRNFLTKAFGKAWIPLPTQTSPTVTYSSTPYMYWMGPGYNGGYPVTLNGMAALVYWLGGVRDANLTFQGFSSNPAAPWDTTNARYKIKGPFYEFDAARVRNDANNPPTFSNSWGGDYAYFSSSDYAYFLSNPLSGTLLPYHKSAAPPVSAGSFYNAKTFQIISSGQDQSFGPGGYYNPPYAIGLPIYDDLANFSSTQLGKKDE
jgi:prepilin-type N-terminal cleavage/methylation domain-containing protein